MAEPLDDLPIDAPEIGLSPHVELGREIWEAESGATWARDILSQKTRRPPWLFDGFLLSHSLTMVSGEPFAGKTMFLMALLASLDCGEPLFGAFAPAPYQSVLFMGQDAPTWDYLGQYQKIARGMGLEVFKHPSAGFLLNTGMDLGNPSTISIIERGIDLYGFNVLVLDTLLEFHSMEENSNTEMKRIMGVLKHLRDKHGVSILFTTHLGKSNDGRSANYRARGAVNISGSVDQHVVISPHSEGGFRFKIPKGRGGDKKKEAAYALFHPSVINGEPALRIEYGESPYKARQALVEQLLTSGPAPRKEIYLALARAHPDWTEEDAQYRTSNTLKYLLSRKMITKLERGLYSLPESPPA